MARAFIPPDKDDKHATLMWWQFLWAIVPKQTVKQSSIAYIQD